MKTILRTLGLTVLLASCYPGIALPKQHSTASRTETQLTTADTTEFGVLLNLPTSDNEVTVANKLNVDCIRASIILTQFTGTAANVDKFLAAGKKVILNLNWAQPAMVNGVKQPVPFPTDTTLYKELLRNVLNVYGTRVAVIVIENEPCTAAFHSGPIEDYLTILRIAVRICHNRGILVADGATGYDRVVTVMGGGPFYTDNTRNTKTLLDAYSSIPLDYVNIHLATDGTSFPSDSLEIVAYWLRAYTGHNVMSNEWHIENPSSSLLRDVIDGWKVGGFAYSLYISTDDAGNADLNTGTALTPLGFTYRDYTP